VTVDEILLEIWRQVLLDGAAEVEVDGRTLRVLTTSKTRLKQVDFSFEGRSLRGIEQNPNTESRWAQMARKGAKIMQFTEVEPGQFRGRFFANVADGKINWYGSAASGKKSPSGRSRSRS